jgi:hypothetical protein
MEGLVTVKSLNGDGKIFQEKDIQVRMVSEPSLRSGTLQNTCRLLTLDIQQKDGLIKSLSNRRIIVKDNQITICTEH